MPHCADSQPELWEAFFVAPITLQRYGIDLNKEPLEQVVNALVGKTPASTASVAAHPLSS